MRSDPTLGTKRLREKEERASNKIDTETEILSPDEKENARANTFGRYGNSGMVEKREGTQRRLGIKNEIQRSIGRGKHGKK